MSASSTETEEVRLLRKWSFEALSGLDSPGLEKLALSLAQSLSVGQIVLGRIMLEVDESRLSHFWGCNSGKHFGRLVLQLDQWQVDDFTRVAKALKGLPKLTEAVEDGRIGWSKIREIVRKATPETEEFWIKMAANRSAPQIQRLVSRCTKGGLPGEDVQREPQRLEKTLVEMSLDEDDRDLFQEVTAELSLELGEKLSLVDAIRYLFMEHRLSDRPVTPARYQNVLDWLREIREKGAQRDRQDAADARAEAEEMGLGADAQGDQQPAEGPDEVSDPPAEGPVGPDEVCESAAEAPAGPNEVSGHAVEGPVGPIGAQPSEPHPGLPYALPMGTANAVHEGESSYELPTVPWEALAVTEGPCPGAPDLILATSCTDPTWFDAGASMLPPGATFDRRGRLRFNPKSRTVTPGQAEYLRRRDGCRCGVPGCNRWVWVHSHHIVWYCRGGPTVPENLVLVCSSCHQLIHDGGLFVSGNAEVRLTWRDRQGRILGLDCRPDPQAREPLLPGEGGGPFPQTG